MIISFVITPKFLESISENKKIAEALNEFRLKYSHDQFKEVMFLVVDENSDYVEKYKNITKIFGEKNLYLKYFIEDFILRLKRENTNLNSNNLHIDIFLDKITDLKTLPKISPEPYCPFPISEDKLKKEFKKLTQFAKKLIIFDPYISQHMTNYSKSGIKEINNIKNKIKNGNFDKFKIKIDQSQGYKYSLRQIIKTIFDLNKNKKMDVQIFSTIKKDDKKNFNKTINNLEQEIQNIRNNGDEPEKLKLLEEYLKSIQNEILDENQNSILSTRIINVISKCFEDLKEENKSIEFDLLKEYSDENKFYKRGFLIHGEEIKIAVDFGQGLNIYTRSTKLKKIFVNNKLINKEVFSFKLQKNPEYHLKIVTNKLEKKKYSNITRFEKYEKIAVNS